MPLVYYFILLYAPRLIKFINLFIHILSVNASSERMEELWVVYVFIWRKRSYAIGEEIGKRKTRINELDEKQVSITWVLRVPI